MALANLLSKIFLREAGSSFLGVVIGGMFLVTGIIACIWVEVGVLRERRKEKKHGKEKV